MRPLRFLLGLGSLAVSLVRTFVFRQPIAVPAWVEEVERISRPAEFGTAWRDRGIVGEA